MATGGTDAKVVGMGDGGMQWVAPMQWVDGSGAVVASIDAAGAIVSASTVTGNALVDAAGAVAFASTVSVAGALTASAAATVGTTLDVAGNFSVATNKATIAAASGNTALAGTLAVTGASTLTGAVTASAGLSVGTTFKLAGIETGLTAHAGGTQAAALALSATKAISVVTTVGTAADSVVLPAATGSGLTRIISNQAAANSMQLFAAPTETINGVASATGVAIAAGKSAVLCDYAAGKWFMNLSA